MLCNVQNQNGRVRWNIDLKCKNIRNLIKKKLNMNVKSVNNCLICRNYTNYCKCTIRITNIYLRRDRNRLILQLEVIRQAYYCWELSLFKNKNN